MNDNSNFWDELVFILISSMILVMGVGVMGGVIGGVILGLILGVFILFLFNNLLGVRGVLLGGIWGCFLGIIIGIICGGFLL